MNNGAEIYAKCVDQIRTLFFDAPELSTKFQFTCCLSADGTTPSELKNALTESTTPSSSVDSSHLPSIRDSVKNYEQFIKESQGSQARFQPLDKGSLSENSPGNLSACVIFLSFPLKSLKFFYGL
jgi:hypothetical protein